MLQCGGYPIARKRLNVSWVAQFPSPNLHTALPRPSNAALRGCFGSWTLIRGAGRLFIEAFSIDFRTCHVTADTISKCSIMAPHALTDLNDTSGYYPSPAHKSWSQTPTHRKSIPPTEPVLHAKTPFGNLGFGSESPKNVWTLSSDEISEVEKNVRSFLSMGKTFGVTYTV